MHSRLTADSHDSRHEGMRHIQPAASQRGRGAFVGCEWAATAATQYSRVHVSVVIA